MGAFLTKNYDSLTIKKIIVEDEASLKKKLLFLPTYFYMSTNIFIKIAETSQEYFLNIYLDPQDPFLYYERVQEEEKIKSNFSETYFLQNTGFNFLNSYLKSTLLLKIIHFFNFLVKLKKYQNKLIELVEAIKPDGIITTGDSAVASMIINKWAIKKNIPFVVIQPTFIDPFYPSIAIRIKRRVLYFLFNCFFALPLIYKQYVFGKEYAQNHIFLWGEIFKNSGYIGNENNVHILGCPLFNNNSKEYFDSDLLAKINLPLPIITICTAAIRELCGEEKESIVNGIIKDTIINNPEFSFILKIHPREDERKYIRLMRDVVSRNYLIINDVNISELHKITSVQISVNSFSSFEAVVHGIPIILLKKDYLRSFDYFNNEIELQANNSEELTLKIKKALSDDFRNEFKKNRILFLESRIGRLDGKSTYRVVKKLKEIVYGDVNV